DADPRAMSFVSAGSPTSTSPVAPRASVARQPFHGQNSSGSEQRFWLVWPALIGGTILGAGFGFWLWARRKVVSVIHSPASSLISLQSGNTALSSGPVFVTSSSVTRSSSDAAGLGVE